MKKLIEEEIIPPEAEGIAREFDIAANEADQLADSIEMTLRRLDQGWSGQPKENFFFHINSSPKELRNYANMLRGMASEIRRVKVTVQKWVDIG